LPQKSAKGAKISPANSTEFFLRLLRLFAAKEVLL
jgi:hypothetical protein